MRISGAVLVVVIAIGCCSCGSVGSSTGSAASNTQPLAEHLEKAGPNPSVSAKMICASEAREDINASLGEQATRVTAPTWRNHLYECTYEYPRGAVTLSVKELNSFDETVAYYDGLADRLGRAQSLYGLGQGAFMTRGGDAVVRKDYKVLLVDTHTLPEHFTALLKRSDVAQNIATTILGCWTGA